MLRRASRSHSHLRPLAAPIATVLAAGLIASGGAAQAQGQSCKFLQPIGGNGSTPIVSKSVGRGKLVGKTNWNTDFIVDRPYASYKFFFTANSSDPSAQYPVQG